MTWWFQDNEILKELSRSRATETNTVASSKVFLCKQSTENVVFAFSTITQSDRKMWEEFHSRHFYNKINWRTNSNWYLQAHERLDGAKLLKENIFLSRSVFAIELILSKQVTFLNDKRI